MSESGATPDSSDAMDSVDPVVDYSYEKRRLLILLHGYLPRPEDCDVKPSFLGATATYLTRTGHIARRSSGSRR
jgi:hypothetical protein